MFYHAFPTDTPVPAEWIAFHAPTLTPMRISSEGPHTAHVAIPDAPPFVATETSVKSPLDHPALCAALYQELRSFLMPGLRHLHPGACRWQDLELPEYLLAFRDNGTAPAIIRTAEPILIIPFAEDGNLIPDVPYYATATQVPGLGWAYWWEDVRRAAVDFQKQLKLLE